MAEIVVAWYVMLNFQQIVSLVFVPICVHLGVPL